MEVNQENQRIIIGIGDFEVGESPQVLETYSLGSCVGVTLYDPITKIGGLAHIMLPDSQQARNVSNPAKFADTALNLMMKQMAQRGAKGTHLVAKIAGGASMFTAAVQDPSMAIGLRNVEAAKTNLKRLGIPVSVEETGGNWGRTMEFHLETGKILVKSALKGTKEI